MSKIMIISGDWDSGKTSRMVEVFEKLDKGTADGFASIKSFDEAGEFIGYSLKQLSTEEILPLAILKKKYNGQFSEAFEFERFVFSEKTFMIASVIFGGLIGDESIKTLLLDEIGPVEIMGKGFADVLEDILKSCKDIYMVVSERNIESVAKRYEIYDYMII